MCWSAHGNELRVHSTATLEPHAGHGTTGLPAQALFRFSSEPERERETARGTGSGSVLAPPPAKRTKSSPLSSPTLALSAPATSTAAAAAANQRIDAQGTSSASTRTDAARTRASGSPTATPTAIGGQNAADSRPVGSGRGDDDDDGAARCVGSPGEGDASPRERGATATKGAAGKLSVRAVEAIETRDGRTVLVCLVSERELPSEVRCWMPNSPVPVKGGSNNFSLCMSTTAVVPFCCCFIFRRLSALSCYFIVTGCKRSGGGAL